MQDLVVGLTFYERQLLRVFRHECLEHCLALRLEKAGLIKFYEDEMLLDGGFPYPFGNVGSVNITFLERTQKGFEIWDKLTDDKSKSSDLFLKYSPHPIRSNSHDRIIFSMQGAYSMHGSGRRDELVVYNRGPSDPIHIQEIESYDENLPRHGIET